MSNWNQEKIKEVVQVVVDKSKSDRMFRDQLLLNPSEAIFQATGMHVPESVRLEFREKGNANFRVELPEFRASEDELSDNELESIAGGISKKDKENLEAAGEFLGDVIPDINISLF